MNNFAKYSGKLIWYFWGIIAIGLLNYNSIKYAIASNIGEEAFLYLLYTAPLLIWGLTLRMHAWGIGSAISIAIVTSYLAHKGINITSETWQFFKPIFMSKSPSYFFNTVASQKTIALFYSFSGILYILAIVGTMIHFTKHKPSLSFNISNKNNKRKHKNPFGSAKIASPATIKKFSDKKGLLIGLMPKSSMDTANLEKSVKKFVSQKSGDFIKLPSEHAVVIAPSRSGKGIGIIVPNILEHNGGVFVLDPKPELACITKRHRESLGQKVYVFDPKNGSGLANCQINILDYLSKDEDILCYEIKELAKLICPTPPNATPAVSHFIDSGRSCIELMLLYMFFENTGQEHSLGSLYDMLTMSGEDFTAMLKMASASDSANGALSRAANAILSTAPSELSGVLSTARNAVSFIDEPYARKATQTSNINKQDFCNDNVDIFICCEINQDATANKLTQLLTKRWRKAPDFRHGDISP